MKIAFFLFAFLFTASLFGQDPNKPVTDLKIEERDGKAVLVQTTSVQLGDTDKIIEEGGKKTLVQTVTAPLTTSDVNARIAEIDKVLENLEKQSAEIARQKNIALAEKNALNDLYRQVDTIEKKGQPVAKKEGNE